MAGGCKRSEPRADRVADGGGGPFRDDRRDMGSCHGRAKEAVGGSRYHPADGDRFGAVDSDSKHADASFTYLRALLVLHDHGIDTV